MVVKESIYGCPSAGLRALKLGPTQKKRTEQPSSPQPRSPAAPAAPAAPQPRSPRSPVAPATPAALAIMPIHRGPARPLCDEASPAQYDLGLGARVDSETEEFEHVEVGPSTSMEPIAEHSPTQG